MKFVKKSHFLYRLFTCPLFSSHMMFIPMHSKHQSLIEPRRQNHFLDGSDEPPPLPVKKKHSEYLVAFIDDNKLPSFEKPLMRTSMLQHYNLIYCCCSYHVHEYNWQNQFVLIRCLCYTWVCVCFVGCRHWHCHDKKKKTQCFSTNMLQIFFFL